MSKTGRALLHVILSFLLVAGAVAAGAVCFGWFSFNERVFGSGAGVSTADPVVEIRAERDGEDIGVTAPSAAMSRLPNGSDGKIRPGSSGEFTFYVRHKTLSSYSFRFDLSVINDEYAEGEGLFAGVSDPSEALTFLNSHLIFFEGYSEERGYYDPIFPGEQVQRSVTADGTEPTPVTVYWVWVAWYGDLFTPDGTLIDADSRERIEAYYRAEGKASEMFNGGEIGEEGYNEADFIIGTTLSAVCFRLLVWGG